MSNEPMTGKASPLPLSLDEYGTVRDANGSRLIVHGFSLSGGAGPKAETAKLVRAANALPGLVEALTLIDEFAWTAVDADCEAARVELNRRIEVCRAALAAAKEV